QRPVRPDDPLALLVPPHRHLPTRRPRPHQEVRPVPHIHRRHRLLFQHLLPRQHHPHLVPPVHPRLLQRPQRRLHRRRRRPLRRHQERQHADDHQHRRGKPRPPPPPDRPDDRLPLLTPHL